MRGLRKSIIKDFPAVEDKLNVAENGVDTDLFTVFNTRENKAILAIGVDDSKKIENFNFIEDNLSSILKFFQSRKYMYSTIIHIQRK